MARFLRSYPNTYAGARPAHSRLGKPIVVGSAVVWYGPGVALAAPNFAADLNRRRVVEKKLSPPTIVAPFVSQVFYGPKTKFAFSKRGKPINELRLPIVVAGANIFAPIYKIITSSAKQGRISQFKLNSPVVVGGSTIFRPIKTTFVDSTNLARIPHTKLRPPSVINSAIVFAPIEVTFADQNNENYARITKRAPNYKLLSPIVVDAAIVFRPTQTHLAYSKRGIPESKLSAPLVILGATLFNPVNIKLAYSKRGKSKSGLFAPAIVGALVVQIFYGPKVALSKIRPVRVSYDLASPIVVNPFLGALGWLATSLAPSRRPQVKSFLRTPSIVFPVFTLALINVTLAPSKRIKGNGVLRPPVVIDAAFIFRPIVTTFAVAPDDVGQKLSRRAPHYKLQSPVVIEAAIIFAPIGIYLSPSARGKTQNRLYPPTIVGNAVVWYGPGIYLVAPRTKNPQTKLHLAPPIVINSATIFSGLRIKLVPLVNYPSAASGRLYPPTIVTAATTEIFFGPKIKLALSKPGKTINTLGDPVVVSSGIVIYGPRIKLSYSIRGKTQNRLFKPIIVTAEQIFYGPKITFIHAPRRRGVKYGLAAPAVVLVIIAPVETILRTTFAPSYRGKIKSLLVPPAVISTATVFRPIAIELTYSRRGKPINKLNAPIVIGGPFVSQPIFSILAPSSRLARKPYSKLRVPIVIGSATLFRPIKISLASQKLIDKLTRQEARYVLRAPTVITEFIARAILITLAPSHGGVIKSRLTPPTIIAAEFFARPLTISLAPSSRGIPKSQIKPPIVIDAAIIFRPISIWIAKQNLVQDRLARTPFFELIPPAIIFTGSQKGYHSRTKINSRESTLIIVLNTPDIRLNAIESNKSIIARTSRDRINDRESDIDIS